MYVLGFDGYFHTYLPIQGATSLRLAQSFQALASFMRLATTASAISPSGIS